MRARVVVTLVIVMGVAAYWTTRPVEEPTPVRLLQQAPHAPKPGPVAPCRETERFVREVFFHGTGPARGPLVCKNVVAVELLRAGIPRGEHVVHAENNWRDIDVDVGGGVTRCHGIALDIGDGWTAPAVVTWLQEKIRALDPALATFEASLLLRTSALRLQNPHTFTLRFATGPHADRSIAVPLGFAPDTDAVARPVAVATCGLHAGWHVLTGHRIDLSGPRFLDVRTKELATEHTDGVLAQIPMVPGQPVGTYDGSTNRYVRYFRRPIHLEQLSLEFTTFCPGRARSGDPHRPYDFNGLYYNLTLAVYTHRWRLPVTHHFEHVMG